MKALLSTVVKIATEAGQAIIDVRQRGFDVQAKDDQSPVTQADLAASQIIVDGLQALQPGYPVICEETEDAPFAVRQQWQRYWLVDPLDGTKSFVRGDDDFAVLIALIENNQPILGIIHGPARNVTYFAAKDLGAFKSEGGQPPQPIHCRSLSKNEPPTVVVSCSHPGPDLADYLSRIGNATKISMSSALKMALVAEGKADVYPRLGELWEWDFAAGQIIVECAGGQVIDLAGQPPVYNQSESLVGGPLIAFGDNSHDWLRYLPQHRIDAATASAQKS